MVANLVDLAEGALKESGLEGQLLGRVGLPPLRPVSAITKEVRGHEDSEERVDV